MSDSKDGSDTKEGYYNYCWREVVFDMGWLEEVVDYMVRRSHYSSEDLAMAVKDCRT